MKAKTKGKAEMGHAEEQLKQPTPKRGILKGVIIILFAILVWMYCSLGLVEMYRWGLYAFLGGLWFPVAVTGLCLWRGIKAIVVRKKQHVSILNISLWAVLLAGLFSLMAWMTNW